MSMIGDTYMYLLYTLRFYERRVPHHPTPLHPLSPPPPSNINQNTPTTTTSSTQKRSMTIIATNKI
eukprot:m.34770 g.34770  ORF g.34770 m.34770 type:complete len:66 (-) comp17032_c0_seq1:229-426(-)